MNTTSRWSKNIDHCEREMFMICVVRGFIIIAAILTLIMVAVH